MVLISVSLIIRENEHVFLVFVHQLYVFPSFENCLFVPSAHLSAGVSLNLIDLHALFT